MTRDLYRVTCEVDNGCTCELYEVKVLASSQRQAIQLVKSHWDQVYDASVEVKSIETLDMDSYTILGVNRLWGSYY